MARGLRRPALLIDNPFQYPRLVTPIRLVDGPGLCLLQRRPPRGSRRRPDGRTRVPAPQREYSSTTSDSFTSCATSPRSGADLKRPWNFLGSTSTQPGKPLCSASDRASWMRACARAPSRTLIVSPADTSIEAMLETRPLTVMARCDTSWRASERVDPNPILYTTLSSRDSSNAIRF